MISKLRPALFALAMVVGLFGLVAAPMSEMRADDGSGGIDDSSIGRSLSPCSQTLLGGCNGMCPLIPLGATCKTGSGINYFPSYAYDPSTGRFILIGYTQVPYNYCYCG